MSIFHALEITLNVNDHGFRILVAKHATEAAALKVFEFPHRAKPTEPHGGKTMKTKHHTYRSRKHFFLFVLAALLLAMAGGAHAQTQIIPIDEPPGGETPANCERIIKADVVALDQAIVYNRLGTINPNGMIYALKKDVVAINATQGLVAGNVKVRPNKRPRPLVLRMNIGDCLQVNFTNLLSTTPRSSNNPPSDDQPATRTAGVHVVGMELLNIGSD